MPLLLSLGELEASLTFFPFLRSSSNSHVCRWNGRRNGRAPSVHVFGGGGQENRVPSFTMASVGGVSIKNCSSRVRKRRRANKDA
jgi:hypothetical protein